jgi:hypothetical protein
VRGAISGLANECRSDKKAKASVEFFNIFAIFGGRV